MTETDKQARTKRLVPVFHKGHYNIIAARFSEQLGPAAENAEYFRNEGSPSHFYDGQTDALVKLAISMAKRFKEDNELFDPVQFLNACSPDPDKYPLGELWKEE